jgi:hypothetical protein
VTNQVNNAGANNSEDEVIFEDDSNLKANNYIASLHDDVEAGEKDIYDNAEKTEDGENKNGQVINNPYINVMSEHISSNVKTKFDGDADVFDLCGDELKKEISTNIIKANKSEPVEAHVCGPFMNSKTGQGSYCVVFGGLQKAWTLKAPFLCGYLCTLR